MLTCWTKVHWHPISLGTIDCKLWYNVHNLDPPPRGCVLKLFHLPPPPDGKFFPSNRVLIRRRYNRLMLVCNTTRGQSMLMIRIGQSKTFRIMKRSLHANSELSILKIKQVIRGISVGLLKSKCHDHQISQSQKAPSLISEVGCWALEIESLPWKVISFEYCNYLSILYTFTTSVPLKYGIQ